MKTTETGDRNPQAPGIDERALECCWMLADVVSYKLCDRRYECEGCPFDEAMRMRRARLPWDPAVDVACAEPLLFHPRHVWARIESGGRIRTGLDGFGRRLMGRLYCVQLPEKGAQIAAGEAAWSVVHHEGQVSLASPVSGVVVEVNERLRSHPALVEQDPYGQGWAIVLSPTDLAADLEGLRIGAGLGPWIAEESEKLMRAFSNAPGSHPTLMDGGRLVEDLHAALPLEERARVVDLFLSAAASHVSGRPAGSEGR